MLGNNLNMLALLCQSTFVGDAAAAVSNTIIALLGQMDEGVSDRFIRRILKTKINIYSKMPISADISFERKENG